jgi:hypothetical protein
VFISCSIWGTLEATSKNIQGENIFSVRSSVRQNKYWAFRSQLFESIESEGMRSRIQNLEIELVADADRWLKELQPIELKTSFINYWCLGNLAGTSTFHSKTALS